MAVWSVGRALAHRNFRLFLLGQSISLIGTWMQQVAMTWLVYRLTNSALLLGLLGFMTQIPGFFIAPVAGVLTDRWNRHRSVIITQALATLQAFVVFGFAYAGVVQVWHLMVLGLCLGIINAFDMPLRQAFLSEMVRGKDDLANAIALNSSIFNGARLVGPSVAGLLLAAGGEDTCFLVNALSYIPVLAALFAMRDLPARPVRPRTAIVAGLKEGFRYAFGFPPIRSLLVLLALVSMVITSLSVLMPVFAKETLQGGAQTLGFLMASSGAGALIGALYLASRSSVRGLGIRIALATASFGLGIIAFSFSHHLVISMGLLIVIGFGVMLQMGGSNTILQTIVEEDKRGRVMSLYTMAFLGMSPVGSLLGGWLSNRIGAPRTMQLAGIVVMGAAALFLRQLPEMRKLIRPIYQQAGILPVPSPAPELSPLPDASTSGESRA